MPKTRKAEAASSPRAGRVLPGRVVELGPCRFLLVRVFPTGCRPRPLLGFVMLNPSKANATQDDPTIRRCLGFAARGNYGGIMVANLSPWRATDPRDLRRALRTGSLTNAMLRENLNALEYLRAECPIVVLGWGANLPRDLVGDVRWVERNFAAWALGRTKGGEPRHPLFVRRDAPLTPWNAPCR
jgi:hypothetical protein